MLGREPSWWAAQLALLGLAAYHLWKIAACLDGCYADIEELFGIRIGQLSFPDMRLNSWILAWVQRALLGAPASLFDANAFHPAEGGLTGSEHMLGVSIPLLPLSVFGPGAVLLHQLATVLSFLIMGWTTFALTRWLTRSDWAALVAALIAMFMPWRIFELAHVQLLSAHWIPLVWLLIGKIMTGEARRWTAPLLAIVLLLQLASSYYLAYYVSASIAVLVPVLALRHGLQRDRLARLGAALAGAYVPFVLLSLPYLQREVGAELILMGAANLETSLQDIFAFLAGQTPGMASESTRLTYQVPLCVLLLAALGAALGRFRLGPPEAPRRLGSFAIALWLIVITAWVFVLGNEVRIGERTLGLPGRLASEWVPGFRHLRTPARWLFVVGIAAPLLAGIGVYRVERALARLAPGGSRVGLLGLRVAVLALVALDMRWQTIPIRSAGLESIARPYEALRELPAGPVVEIPWPTSRLREADTGSRYMLASTLHWKPILNGFAPYPPRTYSFLHRLAWQLPSGDALEKLTRLTGLRWIVVHVGQLAETERREWERLISEGAVRRMFQDPATWVLEVVDREGARAWEEAIRSRTPRTRTLTGLTREPIIVSEGSSHLEVEVAPVLPVGATREVYAAMEAWVENGTKRSWPGIDIQTEGLVQLRYQFLTNDGVAARDGTVPLYVDVPAMGSQVVRGLLQPPEDPGVYRLRFVLVQRQGGELIPIGVGAVERRVTVRGGGVPR
jgi:hypothetical protein